MATSYTHFKEDVKKYLEDTMSPKSKVLDVGAGCGTYSDLFDGYFKDIDAIEIFEENIEKYDLSNKYKKVYNIDICDYDFDYYDLIILGDVLEHISVKKAQELIKRLSSHCYQLLVAVPYLMEQTEDGGNKYEIHLQTDLTKEKMLKRYPELEFLVGNNKYGYFIKKGAPITDDIKRKRKWLEDVSLSIIIPCHNLEKYITPCLESLISQESDSNYQREIIFVCDKCTDNTRKIIEDTMGKSQWSYKLIDSDKGSPGGARNVGLSYCHSDYVWFVDGDDWLTCNNAIDVLMDCMIKDDMDIVEFKIKSKANPSGIFGDGTVWRAMLSSRIIGSTRFNDRPVGEDNDFADELWYKKNPKYGKIDFAPYFYNFPREGSQMDKEYNLIKK